MTGSAEQTNHVSIKKLTTVIVTINLIPILNLTLSLSLISIRYGNGWTLLPEAEGCNPLYRLLSLLTRVEITLDCFSRNHAYRPALVSLSTAENLLRPSRKRYRYFLQ